jgi:mannosyltransferase OCH1-like enzyme
MPIPKKIHYCWLSNEKMPKEIKASIASWKKVMPDYEFILWDKSKFDINSVQWVSEACSLKKWSWASDYIRLFAVYSEGGIYLDTDVYVFKRFDDFLSHDFFTCFEWKNSTKIFKDVINSDLDNIQPIGSLHLEAAIFGGIEKHFFLKDCMNWYENRHFILENGELNNKVIAPQIYAAIAQKFDFKYIHEEQKIMNNMIIYPQGKFFYSPFHKTCMDVFLDEFHENIYAVHWHAAAWIYKNNIFNKIIIYIKQNNFFRKLFKKKPLVTLDEILRQRRIINRKTTE